MPAQSYFVRRRGRVTGPYSLPGLQEMVRKRKLSRFDDVTTDKIAWQAAGDLTQLYPPADLPTPPSFDMPGPAPPRNAANETISVADGTIPVAPLHGDGRSSRTCSRCGERRNPEAVICIGCGYDFRSGRLISTVVESPAAGRTSELQLPEGVSHTERPVSLADVFMTPFTTDVSAEAIALVVWGFALALLINAAVGAVLLLNMVHWLLGLAGLVAYVVLVLRVYSWFFGRYLAIVEQFESGALLSDAPREGLIDLGYGLAILFWSVLPACLFFWSPVLLTAAWLWLVAYPPMGLAVAGAYRSLHPLRVLTMIKRCSPAYVLLLIYYLSFAGAVALAGVVSLILLERLFSPVLAALGAFLIVATLGQYVAVSQAAMFGLLLRRARIQPRLERADWRSALVWITGAMLAIFVIATASWALVQWNGLPQAWTQ